MRTLPVRNLLPKKLERLSKTLIQRATTGPQVHLQMKLISPAQEAGRGYKKAFCLFKTHFITNQLKFFV